MRIYRGLQPGGRQRRAPRRVTVLAAAALAAAPMLAACSSSSESGSAPVLNFYTPADGAEQYAAAAADCSAASGGKYTIKQQTLAKQTDDQRLQLARRIVGGDTTVDIVSMDVTWTAEFAEAGWIVPFSDADRAKVTDGTLAGPLTTATWQDTLYAAPLNSNAQLLFYRKDLMPNGQPPKTWDELLQITDQLAAQGKPAWTEVQAAQYEGLVVWFNSVLAAAGGSIVAKDGTTVTLGDGDAAQQALDVIKRVATAPGADPSLSQRDEGTGRLAFESGKAAFEVNYPFVIPGIAKNGGGSNLDQNGNPTTADTGRKVSDEFAWTTYPAITPDQPSKSTIGGLNIGVSSTSQHPDLDFEAISCLRNPANQLRNGVEGGVPPTLDSLYGDQSFQASYPAWREIKAALDNAAVRPATPAYQSISILLAAALNPPAEINPQADVPTLTDQVRQAVKSEGLVP